MTNEKEFEKVIKIENPQERYISVLQLITKEREQARKEAQVAHARDILRLRSEWIEECIKVISNWDYSGDIYFELEKLIRKKLKEK